MGCDIHMHVEYRRKGRDGQFNHFAKVSPGRDYGVFAALAGVRGDGPEHKGLPADISHFGTTQDYSLYVTENVEGPDECTREQAERWVQGGSSKWMSDEHKRVSGPDWHSESWSNLQEFEAAITSGFYIEQYKAIAAAMRSLEESGNDTRVVYWFDN